MAAHQAVRQLTLQERFQLQAPFLPTITITNLFKPDRSHFDLVANTSTTNNGLRALPPSLERLPRWSLDAVCPASIVRSFCEYGAKLVAIPAGHPALAQYEEGLTGYMVEGGVKMDVHGKGEVNINLYAFAEGKWNHPQLHIDFQTPDFQGYVSECLVQTSVDGMGRLRAQGLARLQEIAQAKGGLGGVAGREHPTDARPTGASTPLPSGSATSTANPPAPRTAPLTPPPPPYSPPARVRTNEAAAPPTPTVSPTGTRPSTAIVGSPTSTEGTRTSPSTEQPATASTGALSLTGDVEGRGLTARAQAAARLKQIAAHIERRHAVPSTTQQAEVEAGRSAAQGSGSAATSNLTLTNSSMSSISATPGSRKRKATPPRVNLRADTEELFNKNQKQRQTHDWRAENGPGGRTANDWRGNPPLRPTPYPSTPTRNAPRLSSSHEGQNRPSQARQTGNLPPRPSNEVISHQHHHNQECRGRCHFEQGSNGGLAPSRPTRFDVGGPEFDYRYVEFYYPVVFWLPYFVVLYRTLNYGDLASASQQSRPAQARSVVNANGGDPRLSQPPSKTPVASRGSQTTAAAEQPDGRSTSGPSQLAPALPPFDRVISPPPYSDYSTRPARAQATDFYLPPPRNYTTSQLTRDPHRSLPPNFHDNFQRTTYDETSLFSPVSTPMERSRPMALAAGGVELVDSDGRVLRNSEVIAKLEDGEVVESKLDGEGWEVVGKKKVSKLGSFAAAQTLANLPSTHLQASKPTNPQAKTSNAPVAGPSRLPPRRAAIGKSKLSTVFSADEDWVEDMETGSSGEFFHHRSQAQELTKIGRQNELDVGERKTRAQRRFKASQKRYWQEKLSKWEEYKKVNGGVNTRDARRRFWVEESEL
ncbi:hypothetical protein P7C70_g8180, partial [Phenoliferia sp. Uapishka_3]